MSLGRCSQCDLGPCHGICTSTDNISAVVRSIQFCHKISMFILSVYPMIHSFHFVAVFAMQAASPSNCWTGLDRRTFPPSDMGCLSGGTEGIIGGSLDWIQPHIDQ